MGKIIGLSVGGVLLVTLVVFLIYFFILREKFAKKELSEIDRRFQFLHALLIGQDAQYVKRLEIISRTNLLYVDIHTKFLKKFKDIRNKNDGDAQLAINSLRDFIDEKDFASYKEALPRVLEILDEYENLVNALNSELLKVVKPEEDCRQSALTYKEQLRRIKQDYYSKESELVLVSASFDEIFKYIDNQFEEFESLVESAQYDEANTILPRIDQILHEITTHISDLPALCTTVALVIPEKIATVESAYKELVDQKYPLYHLHVPQTIEEINKKLEQYTHDIRIFSVDNLADKLEDIIKELDSYFDKFDLEKTSKEEFEAKNESVYSTVNLIERNFIKLRNTIPEVSKYFVINEEHLSGINDIQSAINRVGALKRSLDTFIHSATKQPYSSLVSKMRELSEATSSIISDIDEFNSYIGSLKSDAESAYAAVFSFYSKVKKAEEQVREINVPKINDKYNPRFENLFELLNRIYESLTTSPIDIENVNNLLHQFYEDANALLDDGEVAQDYNMMLLAENAIIFANRHRNHLSDIDTLLSQAETYFENGDFENAYVLAGNTLKKIKDTNGR